MGKNAVALTGRYEIAATEPPKVADLVSVFLERRSRNTRRAYEADLRDFARFAGLPTSTAAMDALISKGPASANMAALAYRSDMTKRGLSVATRNRRLAAIRSALKLGRTLGLLTWTLEVEGERSMPYRDTRGPGEEAYRAMLQVADTRERAILRLLHDLALRRGEVTGLDVEHIDIENGTLSILGKGRTERETLTLPEPTLKALVDWLDERGTEPGALFTAQVKPHVGHRLTGEAVRLIVRACAKRAGVGRAWPHGLRHTGISTACERTNGNLATVARFSRHADLKTVVRYIDNLEDVAGEVARMVAE